MTFDADAHRRQSHDAWERAAAGWGRRQGQVRALSRPVSQWLVEAIRAQPGHVVLELAAGPGETGFLAAELVAPGGRLISSDQAEAMVAVARERAEQLGLQNVEFRTLVAESIDLPTASVDAVICRWGYMLMADPAAALQETRRVLRPGGRVALAVWDAAERNPWVAIPMAELLARGQALPPDPGAPGIFALADRGHLTALLEGAGFSEVELEAIALEQRYADLDDWYDTQLDLSRNFADAVERLAASEVDALRAAIAARLSPYTHDDGELVLPASALVGAASA